MEILKFKINDLIELKKPHPCGSKIFKILRIGSDIRVVCQGCGRDMVLEIKGRHDPCIVPRAVPVVEAAAANAIVDLILGNTKTNRRKSVYGLD